MTTTNDVLSKEMSETERWLEDFGRRHANVDLLPVYWLGMVALILGTVGLLWALPVPGEFRDISPALNWGTALLLAAVVYYFIISLPLAFGLVPFIVVVAGFNLWLQISPWSASTASVGLTVAGLVGLAASRFSHGGVRALFDDVQHMMIAPAWLLSRVYHKLGIPL